MFLADRADPMPPEPDAPPWAPRQHQRQPPSPWPRWPQLLAAIHVNYQENMTTPRLKPEMPILPHDLWITLWKTQCGRLQPPIPVAFLLPWINLDHPPFRNTNNNIGSFSGF